MDITTRQEISGIRMNLNLPLVLMFSGFGSRRLQEVSPSS